ncbi:MAG: hypothetical protein GXY58_19300 [Planctomycetaceae bacterium]|nr:hypothetical protein [Planctomycetaceae bacterium]
MYARMCPRREQHSCAAGARPTASPLRCLVALVTFAVASSSAVAQQRPYHYFYSADMPPGTIGAAQLLRGGPLPGHFQPVEITGPPEAQLAIATEGTYEPPQLAPLRVALLVGKVYRLKVTNIPFRAGQELYPSVEIINRLYPPPGSETRFPIPIELTREELEMALRGQYVVRVIYLENPRAALPAREDPRQQRYFEVGPNQDPLEVADALGRPMAILRIGSRVPDMDRESGRFLFDSPPWIPLPAEVAAETSTEAVPDAGPVPPVVATPPADTAWPAEPHTTRQTPSAAGVTR